MAKIELISEFEGRRIARMLGQLYLGQLTEAERFEVSGWQEGGWVTLRFVLTDDARSYPVEARLHAEAQHVRPQQAKDALLDLLGHFFGRYLSDGRAPFSGPKWEEVEMDGRTVFVRGQELHHVAESDASALLAAEATRSANVVVASISTADPGNDRSNG